MNDLKMIENELVPVYVTDSGEKVVYGTELHSVLQVKSRFNDWVKNRLKDCDATKNKDFGSFTKNLVSGGQVKEYIIKLDTAKEMAMLERNDKGKQVRRYFIRIEEKYKESGIPKTIPGRIQLLAQGYVDLEAKIDSVKEEVQSLKDDLPILPIEAEKITNAAKAKGVHVMGGKSSNAYANKSIVHAVYSDIYGQIYRNFGVKSYRAIRRNQTDKVIAIIETYEPPVILQDRIDSENAQQTLDL